MTTMLQKRGNSDEWAELNPTLDSGEIGYEEDTHLFKVGDGTTPWGSLPVDYIPKSIVTQKGSLLVASGPSQLEELPPSNIDGARLSTLGANEIPVWSTSVNPVHEINTTGDLLVGSADNTIVKLSRGTTGQNLTVQADGSLAWVNMPDLSVLEKSSDMAATYSTKQYASDTYLAIANRATYVQDSDLVKYQGKSLFAYKTAPTSRNNSTALVDDPDLVVNLLNARTYRFEFLIFVTGPFAADLRAQVSGPADAVMSYGVEALDVTTSGSPAVGTVTMIGEPNKTATSATLVLGTTAATTIDTNSIFIRGIINTVSAGPLKLKWGQNVSNATNVALRAGCYLEAYEI